MKPVLHCLYGYIVMMRYGKVKEMPSERLSDGIGAIRERRNIEAPAFQIGRRTKPRHWRIGVGCWLPPLTRCSDLPCGETRLGETAL